MSFLNSKFHFIFIRYFSPKWEKRSSSGKLSWNELFYIFPGSTPKSLTHERIWYTWVSKHVIHNIYVIAPYTIHISFVRMLRQDITCGINRKGKHPNFKSQDEYLKSVQHQQHPMKMLTPEFWKSISNFATTLSLWLILMLKWALMQPDSFSSAGYNF